MMMHVVNKLASSPLSWATVTNTLMRTVMMIKASLSGHPVKYTYMITHATIEPINKKRQHAKRAPSHFLPVPDSASSKASALATQLSFLSTQLIASENYVVK